jgi:hypothetical protein
MGLSDDNIFIFIDTYKDENFKDFSFLKLFWSLIKIDFNNICTYYYTLFSWEKWRNEKYLLFYLFFFYWLLLITYTFTSFLFLKFIFYSLKYIIKYLFFLIDFFFFFFLINFYIVFLKNFWVFFILYL